MRESDTRRQLKRRSLLIILLIVAALAATGLIVHFIEKRSETDEQFGDSGIWADDDEDDEDEATILDIGGDLYITNDDYEAYLIAGTDGGGADLGEGYNGDLADFISVLLIDNTTEKYAFYNIDRNTMVDVQVMNSDGEIEDFANQQICTAHWYGFDEDFRNENLVAAVSEALGGADISGYYVLNMKYIGDLNDAIGGVMVDIDTDMTELDPAFTEGASVLLKGKQAENYLRARQGVGDETNAERMHRQQIYMQNAYDLLIGQLRENPEYINDLYEELNGKVESDGTGKRISSITNDILRYENKGLITFTGETKIADTIGEGIEHEEFYADPASILSNLRKVMNLQTYVEPEDDDEDYDEEASDDDVEEDDEDVED